MKKMIVAGAAMLAATLMTGNAFALPGAGDAKGVTAASSAVTVACGCHHRHYYHRSSCVRYVPVVPSCGCNTCGCGGGLFGGGFFGIF